MKIDVEEELYVSAPEGMAVYAQNPSYVATEGLGLIEALKHEAMHIDPVLGEVYYHPRILRRRSDDNGRTWTEEPDLATDSLDTLAGEHRNVPMHVLDAKRNVLISLHSTYEFDPREPIFQQGNLMERTYRMHYEISRDGGRTWTPAKQVIDCRRGYDATRWGPGIEFGKIGGVADLLACTWLPDGSLVFGLMVIGNVGAEEGAWGTMYVRANWNDDGSDLQFRCGDLITLKAGQSRVGCVEPAVAYLGGERLFNVMRCQGDEKRGIHSVRYSTISEDGGMTWSEPAPLQYDDGTTVWTPASYSQFVRMSKTGKTYWIANILPGPVYGQTPRYPLTIAEFDMERCCILRDTVQVIKDLPKGAPYDRRYTNWGSYEDRETGDLIMTMPEQPKYMDWSEMTRPEDFTADCVRFRIKFAN